MNPAIAGDGKTSRVAPAGGDWVEPELVSTQRDIQACLEDVERRCRSSVDIMVNGTSPAETATPVLMRLLERGVGIRCIYETSIQETPEGQHYLARWGDLGEQQRFVDSVPFRAAVFDRTTVLMPLSSDGTEITSLQVISAGLGEAIAYLFNLLWKRRTGESAARIDTPMSNQDLAVLSLMCEGLSDNKIAKYLGISERTVQRRLRDLAGFFGAVSRPALAARAVMAGAVTPFGASYPSHSMDERSSRESSV